MMYTTGGSSALIASAGAVTLAETGSNPTLWLTVAAVLVLAGVAAFIVSGRARRRERITSDA